ncbi:MAG: zinc-ribbon domain-containing protein, partial [Candidatus Korobacteraceae bacterium]
MAFCSACGTQMVDNAAFCPKCGKATGQPGAASASPPPVP